MEVVWNEPQHFRTVRGKLDKFSTFGVCGGFCGVRGGMRELFLQGLRILSSTYYCEHSICKQLWEKNRSFGTCFRERWS
jgi:hypothetical protein